MKEFKINIKFDEKEKNNIDDIFIKVLIKEIKKLTLNNQLSNSVYLSNNKGNKYE